MKELGTPETVGTETYASILVPLDGSHLAAQAVPSALELAIRDKAHLILLSVMTENAERSPSAPYQSPTREHDARRYQVLGYLEGIKRLLQRAGVVVETRIEEGAAAATIIRVARSLERPLIVITKHGKTASAGAEAAEGLGMVSEEIARDWEGPALFVEAQTAGA
jgi:nucleotide-binding universal stress UspA family protein